MMARRAQPMDLMDRMPRVRGAYTANAPLAPLTWFRVGGAADILFEPEDAEDLAQFLAARPAPRDRPGPAQGQAWPVSVIGAGSNVLIRDGGVRGVVVRLSHGFGALAVAADGVVSAGAAVMCVKVAVAARDAGLAGLEFLRGIPGNVGGAAKMNAGAYGAEIKDVFAFARGIDGQGFERQFDLQHAGFGYRHSGFPPDVILTEIGLRGAPGDSKAISARMAQIASARSDTQPVGLRTGGSTFANPDPNLSGGRKAWELIDAVGGRGLRIGGASVSEQHCNFLINTGAATARDLERLGEELRRRVREQFGIELEWEIRRIGDPASPEATQGKTEGGA